MTVPTGHAIILINTRGILVMEIRTGEDAFMERDTGATEPSVTHVGGHEPPHYLLNDMFRLRPLLLKALNRLARLTML